MIGKLFNGEKFPLLLKLNESEEENKLLPKKKSKWMIQIAI